MSAISHSRGHTIFYDGRDWRYCDNNKKLQDEKRPCIRCGCYPTREGHDACIGTIKKAESVCCGHGLHEKIFIKRKPKIRPDETGWQPIETA